MSVAGAALVLVFTLIGIAMAALSPDTMRLAAKVIVVAMTFWVTDDFIAMALKYGCFARECSSVLSASDTFLESMSSSSALAHAILAQYHAAAGATPPLPFVVYESDRKRLTAIWDERNKKLAERQKNS